jgi:hypothetical protein
MLKKRHIFFSWSPTNFVLQREVLLSPVKMFLYSKLPCLGWSSADFLQGFFRQKMFPGPRKHTRSKISMLGPRRKKKKRVMTRRRFRDPHDQGCQIFLGACYQNRKNVPNEPKMFQMVIKYPNSL